METYIARAREIKRNWFLVDAKDKILGRLATKIATILMGKHKPIYTPFLDTGDFVVVVNAEKIRLTGKKTKTKIYQRFSGYPSGRKEITVEEKMKRHPEDVISLAVKRMLPKTTLGRHMFRKLKVYNGPLHPHKAQCPVLLNI
jgi:large subunit ribosomal protein L13